MFLALIASYFIKTVKAYIKNKIFNFIVEKMNVRQFPFFVRVISEDVEVWRFLPRWRDVGYGSDTLTGLRVE